MPGGTTLLLRVSMLPVIQPRGHVLPPAHQNRNNQGAKQHTTGSAGWEAKDASPTALAVRVHMQVLTPPSSVHQLTLTPASLIVCVDLSTHIHWKQELCTPTCTTSHPPCM